MRWGDALRSQAIELIGSPSLARRLPTWHRPHERGPQPLHGVAAQDLDQASPAPAITP
jgi:hypothetical protein